MTTVKFDLFLSHASEDKDDFVRPLAQRLQGLGLQVWYDEFSIKPGESVRSSVERGLQQSSFGVIVLSRAFFRKKWTEWELNGLIQRHLNSPIPILIPIWHGVSSREVAQFSLSLVDIKAIKSTEGIDAVARQILDVVLPPPQADRQQDITNSALQASTTLKLGDVQQLLQSVSGLIGNDVRISLFESRMSSLKHIASFPHTSLPTEVIFNKSSFISRALAGNAVWIQHTEILSDRWVDLARDQVRSMLAVPVFTPLRDDASFSVRGVLLADSPKPNAFGSREADILVEAARVFGLFLKTKTSIFRKILRRLTGKTALGAK